MLSLKTLPYLNSLNPRITLILWKCSLRISKHFYIFFSLGEYMFCNILNYIYYGRKTMWTLDNFQKAFGKKLFKNENKEWIFLVTCNFLLDVTNNDGSHQLVAKFLISESFDFVVNTFNQKMRKYSMVFSWVSYCQNEEGIERSRMFDLICQYMKDN